MSGGVYPMDHVQYVCESRSSGSEAPNEFPLGVISKAELEPSHTNRNFDRNLEISIADFIAPMSLRLGPRPRSARGFGSEIFKIFGGSGSAQNAQKKVTRDGQQPKRRGPKPDSKPALTRRQELNRQAQRTHRERKEQYIRSMETEVSRLREAYTTEITDANMTIQQQKGIIHAAREENEILKEILAAHGVQYEAELERRRAERPPVHFDASPVAPSSTASQSVPRTTSISNHDTTPATTISDLSPRANGMDHSEISPSMGYGGQQVYQTSPGEHSMSMDHSSCTPVDAMPPMPPMPMPGPRGVFETDPQLQVDFILTLEGPCREHTDYLCRRSVTEADDEDMPFSGHALMATCPPPSYIEKTTHEQPYPHQAPDLPHANLSTLLNLSRQLVTEGQITPIMALQHLKNQKQYASLRREDIKVIIDTLNTKVRCYGFGAVVEDFELMDCLSSVLGTRVELGMSGTADDSMYG